MSDDELKIIADNADMIVKWYAFTRKEGFISILNLKHPDHGNDACNVDNDYRKIQAGAYK